MYSFNVICFLVFALKTSNCFNDVTVEENQMIPPLYEMDDYSTCKRQNGLYCKLNIRVLPDKSDNKIWKIIQRRKHQFAFNRDNIYRYRCIPKIAGNNDEMKQLITTKENEKLQNISLSVQIIDMKCSDYKDPSLTGNDIIFMCVLLSYLILIVASTIYQIRIMTSKEKHKDKVNEYLLCFSIKRNWDKFLKIPDNPDYIRLKSFHGFKALCMCGVIGGHTLMSLTTISTANPEFFETIYTFKAFRYLIHFGLHFVQIYFLLGAWLLATRLFPMYFGDKKVKIGKFLQVILIRFARLCGPIALVVLFGKTTLYKLAERGPQAKHIELNYQACNSNGWATVFLMNSYFDLENQCHFIAWYVSVDFQLFLWTVVLFQVATTFGYSRKQFLGLITMVLGISWTYNAVLIYVNGWPVILPSTPEKNRFEHSLEYDTFALYSSVYSNIGGYCVGLLAGAYYNELKTKESQIRKMLGKCGLISSFMIFLSMYNYSPVVSAIIGASMKPVFTAGIACFLMKTAFSKEKGILEKIFEWKYFELVTKLTYSTYICHYWITFGQELLFVKMFEMSYFRMIAIYLLDLSLSLLLGLIVFIMIECPVRGLLAIWVKRSSRESLKSDSKKILKDS